MELYTFLRILDPERKNLVKEKDFIRELIKIERNTLDLEIEMKNFKKYFIDAEI